MPESVLPNGWSLRLEIDGGQHINWRADNDSIKTIFVRSRLVDLVSDKENFAERLKETKDDVIRHAGMIEGNLNQTDLYDLSDAAQS